jgi:cytochrome o ubiquinol oxidase subunit II
LNAIAILGLGALIGGCSRANWPVMSPDGPIADVEKDLLVTAFVLMLIVVVPVYVMAIVFWTRYRASNTNADYAPNWGYSTLVDAVVWAVPALIVLAIGTLVWDYTHRLDPYKPIAGSQPLEIQVIGEDWKWMFIYPEQNVATVNEVVLPIGRPVTFRITSDTVMNSFYIAGLAGQIYAMAGMETRLNVFADKPSSFTGRNTQYSGSGFADQQFPVKAVPESDFEAWVTVVRGSPNALDAGAYADFTKPSKKVPPAYFSGVEPGLFDRVIETYTGPMTGHHTARSD